MKLQPAPIASSSTGPSWLFEYLVVACFGVVAWWPLLLERPPVADDYFNGSLFTHGLVDYWRHYGIWRIAGHAPPFLVGPKADRCLAFATHLCVTLLLLSVLRKLVASRPIALATASVFAALPFGFQALTWNSALSFALSTAFCLGALLCVLRPIDDLRTGFRAGLFSGLLAFASLSSNEATLLVIPWVAALPIILSLSQRGGAARCVTAALVLAAEAGWIALHLATKTEAFHKNPSFHTPALVSGLFHQVEQLTYFVKLAHLSPWLSPFAWVSAGLAIVLALIARGKLASVEASRSNPLKHFYMALLPIAAVAIYAIGGGFSTDSRKAYVLWPFLLLMAAHFLSATGVKAQRIAASLMLLCCPILVLSAHATARAWADTASLFNIAFEQIRAGQIEAPLRFEWQPNIYAAWPDFDRLCGFRMDAPWVINSAAGPQRSRQDGKVSAMLWNPDVRQWQVEALEP